jgi:hypothetical protein
MLTRKQKPFLNTKTNIHMKKFLTILVIAGSLVACNDSSSETTTSDTTSVVTPTPDDTTKVVTTTTTESDTMRVEGEDTTKNK